jgi:aminomethyltransferase
MGEFILRGAAALAAFDALVFSEVHALKIGPCRYSAFLNDRGGIIDDCVFFKLDAETLYLVTNAGPLETVAALLRAACPTVEDICADTVKIDVQGPASRQVLLDLNVEGIAGMKYWTGGRARWRGVEFVVTRAGYTGELGYELYLPAGIGPELWHALLAHPACLPCGLGARDTLRLETSKPLNGEDLSEDITPLEAGMAPLIQWKKAFRGKTALETLRTRGGYPMLTAIRSLDRRAPRHGFEIKQDGTLVGRVSSGTFGPSLGCGVGLAYLPEAFAAPDTTLCCGPRDLPIVTAAMPLYRQGTCRMSFA